MSAEGGPPKQGPGPREIGLVRHFPTDWNEAGRLQGRADIPLSEAARAELAGRRLPERWRGLPVVSSPLSRALETACALSEGAPVRTDARLVEMSFGEWEGADGAALLADPACPYRPIEDWGWDFRPPGGETPAEMLARVAPALEDAAANGPCVVVCHRGVIRAVLAAATGWGYRGPETFRIKRAALHPVTLGPGGAPAASAGWERLERA